MASGKSPGTTAAAPTRGTGRFFVPTPTPWPCAAVGFGDPDRAVRRLGDPVDTADRARGEFEALAVLRKPSQRLVGGDPEASLAIDGKVARAVSRQAHRRADQRPVLAVEPREAI